MELKISTGLNAGGPDLTNNNPGGIIYMGDDYRANTLSGNYVIEQRVDGVWGPIQTSNVSGTTLATSVSTGVGSFHLGDYHSIGSGGQNVLFINHESNLAFYPGTWQAESLDGLTVVEPVSRFVEYSLQTGTPNGLGRTGNPVPYQFTLTPTVNVAFYNVQVRLEEAAPEGYTWIATSATGKEFMRKYDPAPRINGEYVTVQFEYPVYLRAGDVANIKLQHGRTGAIINCTAGTTIPTEPWRRTKTRRFIDANLQQNYQTLTIPAGSDNATYFTMVRPPARQLRITGYTPSVVGKTLAVYSGATLYNGYQLITQVTGTVASEFFTADVEIPMNHRFLYFQKNFTDTVNSITVNVEPLQ